MTFKSDSRDGYRILVWFDLGQFADFTVVNMILSQFSNVFKVLWAIGLIRRRRFSSRKPREGQWSWKIPTTKWRHHLPDVGIFINLSFLRSTIWTLENNCQFAVTCSGQWCDGGDAATAKPPERGICRRSGEHRW